jgi:hypothetical protein
MADVRGRQVFFGCEIMRRKQTLERELKLTPNFSLSEMRVAFSPLLGTAFEHIVSLQFLSSSFVAAFHGLDSDARNGVCFSGSRQAHEIIAPEAPHSHAALLSIRSDAFWINKWCRLFANASSEGERCTKDTDHPLRHPLRHHRIFGRVPNKGGSAWRNDPFGLAQNTGLGWSDPPFVHVSVPKIIRGVAPAQLRGDRAEYFVRVQMKRRTTVEDGLQPPEFVNRIRSRKRGPQSCQAEMKTTLNF